MNNRKATFAKRQRELDQAERARARESRRNARGAAPKDASKGPQIDWGEGINLGEAEALPDGVVVPPNKFEELPVVTAGAEGEEGAEGAEPPVHRPDGPTHPDGQAPRRTS